jgi:hypothetical protein
MGKLIKEAILACILILLITGYAHCTKPGSAVNPNGSPSGGHFNLNIIAEKGDFSCPGVSYDEYGDPVYGNVIFIPEHPEYNMQIVMESGKKGPKSAPDVTELQVTDTCTGFAPNDPATLRLPKNENGYRAYARVLGKPSMNAGDLRTIEIYDPEFVMVQDELGNDLLYLGLVTDRGFLTTSASFVRISEKSRPTDITGLFQWSGSVCYLNAPDGFTLPDSCCADHDSDGIFDECSPMAEDFPCEGTPAYCMEYLNEWVFNIGDFAYCLWNMDNNGAKLLQVRFYPL